MGFIIANPSSYAYLDNRRFQYNCGHCNCGSVNCTCDRDCTSRGNLGVPDNNGSWVCFDPGYNSWPYGLDKLTDGKHVIPYAMRSPVDIVRKEYKDRSVTYLVGENDTCHDGLPTCRSDCWKRDEHEEGEWPCFPNHMDTRCPSMLEGPFRRRRGIQYMLIFGRCVR